MLKKAITLATVVAVVGLLSVATAFASERTRAPDDVTTNSAGLQIMEAAQLQNQLQAQDPAIGGNAVRIRTRENVQVKAQAQSPSADQVMEQVQTRTRTQAQLMVQNPECTDCDGPDQIRDRDRIQQDAAGTPGPNRGSAGNAGPNGDGTCVGTGPSGSQGSGGARAGRS